MCHENHDIILKINISIKLSIVSLYHKAIIKKINKRLSLYGRQL